MHPCHERVPHGMINWGMNTISFPALNECVIINELPNFVKLTDWAGVTHMDIRKQCHHWSRWWLAVCSLPRHQLNNCRFELNWNLKNNIQRFESKLNCFDLRKWIEKCRVQNGDRFSWSQCVYGILPRVLSFQPYITRIWGCKGFMWHTRKLVSQYRIWRRRHY